MIAEFIDPAILGFILVGVMLFAIFVGFPISFTLIFLGFVFGYLGFGKLVFYLMTLQFSMVMTEQTLAAVPLFVFNKYRFFSNFWFYLLFYFPGLIVFCYMTIGFVQESIMRSERGMDTTWMPYMWPIKTCLLIGIVFLLIQGVSEIFKSYWAADRKSVV